VEIVRLIGIVALAAAALGVIFEFLVPASAPIIDASAAFFAVATWIVPALIHALTWNKKPRTSLAAVGRAIGFVVQAACLSVAALSLALVTLVFAPGRYWAWPAILTVVAFWILGAVLINVGSRRRASPPEERPKL
jgi:L-asparagine transporter-like permease